MAIHDMCGEHRYLCIITRYDNRTIKFRSVTIAALVGMIESILGITPGDNGHINGIDSALSLDDTVSFFVDGLAAVTVIDCHIDIAGIDPDIPYATIEKMQQFVTWNRMKDKMERKLTEMKMLFDIGFDPVS